MSVQISIVTFDGFNEIDSFVALNILSRVSPQTWKIHFASLSETVRSMNGVEVKNCRPLDSVRDADAVLFGSGTKTLEQVKDQTLLGQIKLDSSTQLIGSQCSGVLFIEKLALLSNKQVCTDLTTRSDAEEAGLTVLDQPFCSTGNVATAGGCLSSVYIATWLIWRLEGEDAARAALNYVAPVGEKEGFVSKAADVVSPFIPPP